MSTELEKAMEDARKRKAFAPKGRECLSCGHEFFGEGNWCKTCAPLQRKTAVPVTTQANDHVGWLMSMIDAVWAAHRAIIQRVAVEEFVHGYKHGREDHEQKPM